MSLGKPMTVSSSGVFLYRAHKAPYEIDGILLVERECQALMMLNNKPATLSDVVKAINTSIRAMKMSADRLRHLGLIDYSGDAESTSELSMTARGRNIARALSS